MHVYGFYINHMNYTELVRKFRGVLVGVQNDDVMRSESQGVKTFVTDAQTLIRRFDSPTPSDLCFLQWLYSSLESVVDKQLKKKELWTEFHVLRTSPEFSQQWKSYLEKVGMQSKAVFIQTLTSETFEQLLSERICAAKTTQCGSDEVQFTYEEENAIRYMAGFVVRRLQKQLDAKDIDMLIESEEATISDANSTEWINLIDRGGLVHVNDACYQLFLAIEHATRQELQISKVGSMDDDFRTYLENTLSTDDDILFNWTMITGDETEREDVLLALIKLWITTRGFSFAKAVMEKYRNESKKTTTKSKGLRTRLFTDKV